MIVITHRLAVLTAAALFVVATAAGAQEAPTSDASKPKPATSSEPAATETTDSDLVLAEPDFRVLNLPSTLRMPLHGSSFQLTHRFNGNLRQGSFDENASQLFGLDQ